MFSHWVLSDSFVTPDSSVHGQDYRRKLLFPAPGDLPHPEIEFTSLHLLHFSQILYHGVTLANTLDLGKSGICCCVCVGGVCVSCSAQLFVTPWTVAHQAPLSMDFSGREYWSGLPFPSPENHYPGIEPGPSTLQADFLLPEPPGKPLVTI